MPWKESSVEEERLRFVARLLNGESMTEVCRSFGISRKTGYKIFNRYKEIGPVALSDRSRRPVRYANQLPEQIERLIVEAKQGKPPWGARKIRELLVRRLHGDVRIPDKSTVHSLLARQRLLQRAQEPRRHHAHRHPLAPATQPRAPRPTAQRRRTDPGKKPRPCRARPPWAGQAGEGTPPSQGQRNAAVARPGAQ